MEHICEDKEPVRLYRIGMFAGMNHVTIKALRHYDEQGLLKPAQVDTENGYRYYSSGQLTALHQILALRNMGFSLEEIRQVQNGASEKNLLIAKKQQLLKEIAERTGRLSQVESYLAEDKPDAKDYVLVKSLPEVTIAYMQKKLPDYGALFEFMPMMGSEMERLGCSCAEPEYCFTHYLEPGFREEDISVELCQAVAEAKPASELVQFRVLPMVEEAACILHTGAYEDFPRSYGRVIKFIEENGYVICGKIREVYIDGVWNRDTVEEWLTEVQVPVRRAV